MIVLVCLCWCVVCAHMKCVLLSLKFLSLALSIGSTMVSTGGINTGGSK